jgi:mannosyl-oligosaccharide alpha-1,2-mannosidase
VQFGIALVDACYDTYSKTATGIGPEIFQWQDNKQPLTASNNPGPPANQSDFYDKAGFWIPNGAYVLRPEVLESIYYAYRATGNTKYQEWAWQAYLAINKTTAVGSGYSSINDVNKPDGGGFQNFQESFFFAEVLKYAYLIHAEVGFARPHPRKNTRRFIFFPPPLFSLRLDFPAMLRVVYILPRSRAANPALSLSLSL